MNPHPAAAHKSVKGRIDYVSDRDADRGRPRGSEDFSILRYADGTQTLSAHSTIADPPHVERDVVQSVDANMRPLDCFVRVRTGHAFTGSGWFRWTAAEAECEALTATEGRISKRVTALPGPMVFCNHAIVGDAWMTAAYPFAQGPGAAFVANMFSPSANTQGATGPTLERFGLGVIWLGCETITVAAGRFEANTFRLGRVNDATDVTPDKLAYEMWVLTDGSYVPALTMYRGERRYELAAYSQGP